MVAPRLLRPEGGQAVDHSQWKTRRSRKLLDETVEESPAYVEAGYAFALGQAVYDRRTALGLSQTELARRAGMTQPQISTIEGGDSVPTLPLLTRLTKALDASLTIDLDGDTSTFVFTAHHGDPPGETVPSVSLAGCHDSPFPLASRNFAKGQRGSAWRAQSAAIGSDSRRSSHWAASRPQCRTIPLVK